MHIPGPLTEAGTATISPGEQTVPLGTAPPPSGQPAPPVAQAAPARRTKIAIVGFADSWPLAPFSNNDWMIFCLNEFYDLAGPRINFKAISAEGRLIWLEVHRRYDLENDPNIIARHPQHLKKLAEMNCPVWMQAHYDDIPKSQPYPLARVLGHFGHYFTNSISYMMALAILAGMKEIGLYGVNMAMDSEYAGQRASCEYMVGWARALGITVEIPPQSDLLHAPYLYGFEDHLISSFRAKLEEQKKQHVARMREHEQQRDQQDAAAQQLSGAIQQIDVTLRTVNLVR